MSHVTCHFFVCLFFCFFLDKGVKFIGGGSVINGAYPVFFFWKKWCSLSVEGLLSTGPTPSSFFFTSLLQAISWPRRPIWAWTSVPPVHCYILYLLQILVHLNLLYLLYISTFCTSCIFCTSCTFLHSVTPASSTPNVPHVHSIHPVHYVYLVHHVLPVLSAHYVPPVQAVPSKPT